MRACVWGRVREGVCLSPCSLTNPACNAPPLCGLSGSTSFLYYFISGTTSEKKKKSYWTWNTYTLIFLYKVHSKHFSFYEEFSDILSYKLPVILVAFWLNLNFLDRFSKKAQIQCHQNPSSGSRVVPCGRVGGQTDITKLTVAFRNFANAHKKSKRLN